MSEIDPSTKYITTDEVAERTTLSKVWLERARAEGIGPAWRKIGRRVVYRLDHVISWIESGAAGKEHLSSSPRAAKKGA